jgi:phosphoribosylaminoimidazole (AIR) synthetase
MLETFNCGVGMMVICEKNAYEDILNLLAKAGEPAWLAGEIHSYKGERIRYTL